MKTRISMLLFALLASVGSLWAQYAEEVIEEEAVEVFTFDEEEALPRVQIGRLYYELDSTNLTARVTYEWEPYGYGYETNYSYLTSISIPSTVTCEGKTYAVTSIGEYAFYNCSDLTDVTIPSSVTTIGGSAFEACTSLNTLIIPESVTSIGYDAFANVLNVCYNGIADEAQAGARCLNGYQEGWLVYQEKEKIHLVACDSKADEVIIPESVTTIGAKAFANCQYLIQIEFPNSLDSIEDLAFLGCGLTDVRIPKSVSHIGMAVFGACENLTSISVEAGNSKYDSRENCNAIIETTSNTLVSSCNNSFIPKSVKAIGELSLALCNFSTITIPNGVKRIGAYSMAYSGLKEIVIPKSVTVIEDKAFAGCSQLETVTLKNKKVQMGEDVFDECENLLRDPVTNAPLNEIPGASEIQKYANYDHNPIVKRLSKKEIKQCKTPSAVAYNFIIAGMNRDYNRMLSLFNKESVKEINEGLRQAGKTVEEVFDEAYSTPGKLNIHSWPESLTKGYEVAVLYVQDEGEYDGRGTLKIYISSVRSDQIEKAGFQDIERYDYTNNVKVLVSYFEKEGWRVIGFK